MNKFGAKLLSEIVEPILSRKVLSFDVYDDQEHFVEIKFDQNSSGSPDPIQVLDILTR
jgi:hypothetical protein